MAINLNVTRADSSEYDAQLLLGIKGDPGKSAYEYAVDAGYTGTETDFTLLMESLEEFQDVTATAETLDAGESATASFSDGELSLGIPKGYSAGFGTVSATVDANHGVPAVTVTASGEDTAKNFAFAFSNLQPAPYDDSVIQARMDSFTNLAEGSTTGDAELIDGRVGADGVTYTNIGDAIRGQVTDLKSDLSKVSDFQSGLSQYLYKKNTYINGSNVETALSGYDLYKIPVTANSLITLTWDTTTPFYNALNAVYVFKFHNTDSTYTALSVNALNANYNIATTLGSAMFITPSGVDALYICTDANRVGSIAFCLNYPYDKITSTQIISKSSFAQSLTDANACKSSQFSGTNGNITNFASPYYTLSLPLKTGDKITFNSLVTGTSHYGTFRLADGTVSAISSAEFTAGSDGIISIYENPNFIKNATLYPVDGIDITQSKPLDDKVITFFGDSITYYYLWEPYVLAELGGTGNNCGIGSTCLSGDQTYSFWKDVRINAVKATDPDIVTIMGGANDLVQNPYIGTESNLVDKDTDTFIGAYSYILDTLLTWKPSLKIVIIGTSYAHNDGADYSDTVTYGDFANACKLVADYYHLPYVDLYNESGFNKYTMNSSPYNIYSADHIHPNSAGAKIIASMVIQKLREVFGIA